MIFETVAYILAQEGRGGETQLATRQKRLGEERQKAQQQEELWLVWDLGTELPHDIMPSIGGRLFRQC